MKKYNKSFTLILIIIPLILSIMSISLVTAGFGVASRYSENDPMVISPGETVDTYFKIQNTIRETADVTIRATITKGSEIASITSGETYTLSADEQKIVNVKVTAPTSVPIGTEYTVEALFEQTSGESTGGTVQFIVNVDREFKVIIAEKQVPPQIPIQETPNQPSGLSTTAVILIILVLLLIIAIIVILLKKKPSQLSQIPTKSNTANTTPVKQSKRKQEKKSKKI
jgi:hypothetical protein